MKSEIQSRSSSSEAGLAAAQHLVRTHLDRTHLVAGQHLAAERHPGVEQYFVVERNLAAEQYFVVERNLVEQNR